MPASPPRRYKVKNPASKAQYKPNELVQVGHDYYLRNDVKPKKGTVIDTHTTNPAANTDPNAITGYQGNGGKPGELPKQDKSGKFSYQKGYDQKSGSWDYLGKQKSGDWSTMETFYKLTPPPQEFSAMTPEQKQQFLGQATRDLSQNFINAVQTGQTDLIHELGTAVTTFKDALEQNNLGVSSDLRDVSRAIEASGLSFTGESKRLLGEGFGASGVITGSQRAKLQQNLADINAVPGSVTTGTPGAGISDPGAMPQPPGINGPIDPATGQAWTQDGKDKAWQDFYNSPTWLDYQKKVTAISSDPSGTGISGTGTYGTNVNLDPYAGTGLDSAMAQGSVFRNQYGTGRTQIAESARTSLNSRARELGTTAERLLGSGNLGALAYPTVGGHSIINPATGVLGSSQAGFQTNQASKAGSLYGDAMGQIPLAFPT